jgi:ammonium transporter, Amt family
MQTFSITCIITVLWFFMGYSLAFGAGGPFIGGSDRFWLIGAKESSDQKSPFRIGTGTKHPLNCAIPETVFMMFQCTFAIITAAIVCGSFAERMKFSTMVVFIFFWHFLVYCVVAHWEWAPDGFLFGAGTLDYAGGDVVHVCAGMSGLAASIIIGPRKGFGVNDLKPHNVLYTMIGGSMLWVGWFGFNAGSAGGAGGSAGFALLTTQISAGTSGVTWMLLEWVHRGRPSVLGIVRCVLPAAPPPPPLPCLSGVFLAAFGARLPRVSRRLTVTAGGSGAVAGLVVITPGA